jgi:GNAT superfamily N-acetyltransferase
MSEIRLLAPADAGDLMVLSRQAGWNQTEADWRRLIELEPEGCFGIEAGGRVAASTTVTCYGGDLAWLGMVLTHTAHRGRGYAGRLLEHALDYLRRREAAWIKLDATDMGRPIYARMGFADECAVERWKRPAGVKAQGTGVVSRFVMDEGLDVEAFGARRRPLLESLAAVEGASIPGDGFALARPGAVAAYFGPCVAQGAECARDLLEWFLGAHGDQDAFWDLLPGNAEAARLAREYGFAPVRRLTRMAMRGAAPARPLGHKDAWVYAIAGFEYG